MAAAGDKVQLKSGGPVLNVLRVIGDSDDKRMAKKDEVTRLKGYDDGDVICEWEEETAKGLKLRKKPFKASTLMPASETGEEAAPEAPAQAEEEEAPALEEEELDLDLDLDMDLDLDLDFDDMDLDDLDI